MGIFSEALAKLAPVDATPSPDTIPNSLRKGWDSGLLGAGSQLQSVAGLVGEALGADEFARNRAADSRSLRERAEVAAPQVGSWGQVHGLRDFGNYAAGLVGSSAPVSLAGMGAAALTGGGVVPGILAAGAATAPFEMGDVIQKQEADPEALRKGAGERLGAAALGGGLSALAQGVVPGIVGKQLGGLGATRAAGQSLKRVIGQNLAGDALLEGGAEGGGDIIKQYAANPNRDTDWESVKENAIGGAVAGGAMGGIGAAGELAHRNAPMVGDALSSARTSINDRLAKMRSAAGEQVDAAAASPAGQKVRGVMDDLNDLVQRGKAKFDDTVDKVRNGEELGIDPKELATATNERIKEMFDFSDNEKVKAATQWGKEMLDDVGLDAAKRQEVVDALNNVKDRTGQVAMAGLKKAWDTGRAVGEKVDAFASAVKQKREDMQVADALKGMDKFTNDYLRRAGLSEEQIAETRAKTGTKKSADYSGVNKTIAEQLRPLLEARQPDIAKNPKALSTLADGLREAVNRMPSKQLSSDAIFRLIDTLGADTVPTLTKAWEAVGDPAKAESFYKNLNEIADIQQRNGKLSDLVGRSLTEASQKLIHPDQYGELTNLLLNHARGVGVDPNAGPNQRKAIDAQFRSLMAEHFGDKADAVSLAIEKEAGLGKGQEETAQSSRAKGSDEQFNAETGERQSPEALDTMRFGLTEPDAKGNRKSKLNGELMSKDNRYTKQHIEDLKVKYPKHDVRWEKAEGSDLGHIVVEKAADPEALTTADIESMRLDKKYPNSKDKITVGGKALDTKRIAKVMDRRLEYSTADEQSRAHRMARMFNEGVARLMELHGKFEVPDSAVIGEVGGKPFTFGMAKKLENDTAKPEPKRLKQLREEYKKASPEDRVKIKAEADAIRDAGKIAEPDSVNTDDVEMTRYESGKGVEIHAAAKDVSPSELVVRSNMDGSGHSHNASDRANLREALGLFANELMASRSKMAKSLGEKLKALAAPEVMVRMTDKDQAQLAGAMAGRKLSRVAEVVNKLAEKYGGPVETVIKPGSTPDPKAVAAKKAAFLERAASGDKALIKELSTSDDAKGLQRAIGALAEAHPESEAMKAATARLSELVKNPDTAYGLQTRKYSLEAVRIHTDLGRDGFAATHDSPIRHEGKFDWRAHQGKGEGNAAFGAGTYLSTADGVHRSYKNQFTAAVQRISPPEGDVVIRGRKGSFVVDEDGEVDVHLPGGTSAEKEIIGYMIGGRAFAEAVEATKKSADRWFKESLPIADVPALADARERMEERKTIQQWIINSLPESLKGSAERWNRFVIAYNAKMADLAQIGEADIRIDLPLNTKSPTYEVSVDIKPEQLLDWNKPLSEQSELVRDALRSGAPNTNEQVMTQIAEALRQKEELSSSMTAFRAEDDTKSGRDGLGFWDADDIPYSEERKKAERQFTEDTYALDVKIYELRRNTRPDPELKKTGAQVYNDLTKKLGSQAKASDYLQSLGILGHKFNAAGGKNDAHPNYVIYDDSKITTNYVRFDKSAADPNATHTQAYRDSVKDHITKVLGNTVKVAWKNLTTMQHAGDYTHTLKLIRLSVHALDPMSTAYHESLHAFFAQLRDAGAHDITGVLEKAASSQHVIEQLRERYKNQPDVLAQLADPEERAAYMYQTWASDPTFKITPSAKGVFARIKEFITHLMGAWTNDERALHIMKYFHEGEYAKNMSSPSGVRAALMNSHRSQILETAKSFAEPLAHLADAIVGTGGERLRDTGIPALHQLADIIKRNHTERGGDQGFIQASRVEAAKMRTRLGVLLEPYTREQLRDAMEALHSNTPAASPEARLAVRAIKGFLKDAHSYMTRAGVNLGNLGPDYFPRVWDTHYISKNQQAFRDMLEPYIRRGEMKGSADELIRNLTTRGGVELGIESREPGMQFKKERKLDFITPQDAAQFVEKDLLGTLSSYINQAARKAEWTRRLGGGKLEALINEAKQQGATKEHIELAESYMKGVDGTLGDDLNPTARRIMGDMIVYQNVRLLPMAAFSMLIDPNGVLVRGGTVGEAWSTFKRGLAGIKDTFKKDGGEANADEATKWAELVGVVDSAMMSHAMDDVFSQGMVGGTAQKINNAFFKYNLVEGLNRNFRIGATEAAIKFLARHAGGLDGTGPSAHSERWMKELGLQKGDIKLVGTHIALTELEGLQAAQVQRVHAAINQWVDGAILRPDAADKPIWMNDPHYALISHLKQFVFSFQKTILERVVHEFRNGNYTPMMALASYVPIMMAADFAKGLLVSGGDTPEWQKGWGPAEYVGYGIERAGLFGVGQFGVDIAQNVHRGGVGVGALVGPTIEQFGDVISTLGGHKQFGNTVIDALPANTLIKGWSGRGEAKADPVLAE